jgi:hypothetical protein
MAKSFAEYLQESGTAPTSQEEKPVTPQERPSSFAAYLSQPDQEVKQEVAAKPKPDDENWAGTGPSMSFGEYLKSGFAGRFVTNAIRGDSELMMQADETAKKQLGPNYKQDPMKFQQVFTDEYRKLVTERDELVKQERLKNPEPTFSKSIQDFGKELVTNPWQTAKSMVYELGKDPELLFLGSMFSAPKAAATTANVGKTAKAVSVAKDIGKSAAKAGTTGLVAETVAQVGQPGGMDTQRILNTAGNFAVLGATIHAGAKGYKSVFGKSKTPAEATDSIKDLNDNLNKLETEIEGFKQQDLSGMEMPETPKFVYHGTRGNVTQWIDAEGNLHLKPSENFDKKVSSISFAEDPVVAEDYATRMKGYGPEGRDFTGSKLIKIDSSKLPNLTKETMGELAINTKDEVVIPKGSFEIEKLAGHDLLKEDPRYKFYDFLVDEYGEYETEATFGDRELYINRYKDYVNSIKEADPTSQFAKDVDAAEKLKLDLSTRLERLYPEKADVSPTLKVAGDVFKEFDSETATEAVMKTLREINVNNRLSTIWRRTIEKLIPEASVRERTTMALEGERSYDKLLTDEEKRQTLYGDTAEVRAEKEAKNIRPEIGLTGVLNLYEAAANRLGIGGRTDAALPDNAFRTFWDNYKKRNGLINKPVPEQIEHLNNKLTKLRYAVNRLEMLPSEEHAIPVMKQIQGKLAEIGKVAQEQGLMEHLRHNYISHVLNWSESALSEGQRRTLVDALFSDKKSRFNRDFTQHRVYNTIRELEAAVYDTGKQLGIDTRGVKVERDVAKIAEIYQKSMMNASLIKRLLNHLEKTTTKNLMGDDIPLITKDPQIAFRHKYQFFEGKGSQGLEGYAIHPDIVDLMRFIANQTDPNIILKAMGQVSMLSKYLTTMASLFHATSLFVARATSTPGTMLKEVFTGGRGTRLALEELENNGLSESVKGAQRGGLQIELPEDAARTVLTDISNSADKLVGKVVGKEDIRVTRRVVDPLEEKLLQKMNRFTWDYMHAAGKLHLYQTWFSKIKAKNPELSDEAIAKEVASYVNNTLGGLDWLKIAQESSNQYVRWFAMKALNPQGRQWMQAILFAPDWTISTIRSFTKALPKELLKPQNWELREGIKGFKNPKVEADLARRYVVNTAIMWLTILNGFNYAFSGHFIWENEDPTRVDLGDGTTMQMSKHSMEFAEWVLHPLKTASNKLAIIPKTAFTAYLASQGMARDIKTPFGKIEGNSLFGIAAAGGQGLIPFQVNAAVSAPAGEKTKRGLASFLGIPIYGQTNKMNTSPDILMERKKQKKESRRENKLEKMQQR